MMKVKEAIRLFKHHQKTRLKEKTRKTYRHLLKHFEAQFGDCVLESIEPEALYEFLESLTEAGNTTSALCATESVFQCHH